MLLHIVFIMISKQAAAQNDIQVSLSLNPPYSPYFSDYLVYENKTTLILTGPNALNRRFYLRGSVTGDNGISISTKQGFKPAQALQFTSGPTLILKGIDIEEYFKWDNANVFGTDLAKLAQGDGLPEGNYTICIRAYDYTTNEPLSLNTPNGCVTISIKNVEPPIINLPRCGTNITPNPAQNFVFSWNPPPGTPPNTKYLLKLAEMQPGFSNYNDALNTLTTPAFYEKELSTSTFSYTLADAALTVGKTYAFKVVAFDPTNKTNFRNNGESEVCYFTYGGDTKEVKQDAPILVKKQIATKFKTQIPTITIKGKLNWAFHKDDEVSNKELFNMKSEFQKYHSKATPRKNNAISQSATLSALAKSDPTIVSQNNAVNAGVLVKNSVVNTNTNGGYSINTSGVIKPYAPAMYMLDPDSKEYSNMLFSQLLGKKRYGFKKVRVKIIYVNKTEFENSFAPFDDRPAASSNSPTASNRTQNGKANTNYDKINSVFSATKNSGASLLLAPTKEKNLGNGRYLLGSAITDEDGDFTVEVISKALWNKGPGDYISLEYDYEHFIFPVTEVQALKIEEGKTLDLGTITGMAKTMKLQIITQSIRNQSLPVDDINNFDIIDDATIRILRKKSVYDKYANLKYESQGAFGKTKTENEFEVVYEGKSGEMIPRLFFTNENLSIDESAYQIEVTHKEFKTKLKGFTNLDPNIFEPTVKDVIKNYKFTTGKIVVTLVPPTDIKGTLVSREGEIPLGGMRINVLDAATGEVYEDLMTETDSAGNFWFRDVPPNPAVILSLEVDMGAIATVRPSRADGNEATDPQNFIVGFSGDSKGFKPLFVSAGTMAVKGKVVNDEGATIANAQLKWKQGGKAFFSDEQGNFTTFMLPGTQYLIAYKNGYKETEVKVEIEKVAKNSKDFEKVGNSFTTSATKSTTTNQITNLVNTNNGGQSAALSQGFLNATMYTNAILPKGVLVNTKKTNNIGNIVLKRFYVSVKVKNAVTNTVVANARVQASDDGKLILTNANGIAVLNDAKGNAPSVIVEGPAGSAYVAKQIQFDLKQNEDTAYIEVALKEGTLVTGKVLLNGSGVTNAQVFVEGANFLRTVSDNQGNYSLALEPGDFVVTAAKPGLIGDKKELNLSSGAIIHNFNLKDAGFNAETLLGFKIELYESKAGANANEKIISGAFVNIPENTFFKVPNSFKIPFHNLVVTVQANKPIPKNGEVKTDVSEIPLELFEYVPLKLRWQNGIIIKANAGNNDIGIINGEALLDVSKLVEKVTKLNIPKGLEWGLQGDDKNKPKEFTAFISNGALPINANNLKLIGLNSNDIKLDFMGANLTIDLAKSYIFKDGIQLGGSANFGSLPLIGNKTFLINTFKINTAGDVNFDVAVNFNEEINLSIWKMRLGLMRITDYGLTVSGSMAIEIPDTDKISASFANLGISANGISGGSFNLYSKLIADGLKTFEDKIAQAQEAYNKAVAEGSAAVNNLKNNLNDVRKQWQDKLGDLIQQSTNDISLFKIISYKPLNTTPFSLTRVAGTSVYKLQGSGEFGLSKFIDERIKLEFFSIATDGKFAFKVPLNIRKSFGGVADIELTKLGYDGFEKSFEVGGGIYLKIPGFGVGASATIKYFQAGRVEINELGFKLAVGPIGEFAGRMKIMQNGFEGEGKIEIAKAIGIGGKFVYEKSGAGFRFGVNFQITPSPIIPVGLVNIGVKGGGFEINTNPGKESVKVTAVGSLSLVVDPAAVLGINPLTISITVGSGGPVIEGKGTVVVAAIPLGEAGFIIDFPNKYMSIYAEGGVNMTLIPAAPFKCTAGFRVSASLAAGNQYFMMAMYQSINIVNIIRQDVNIAFAWGCKKNQGTVEDRYLAFIPDYYLTNGKVFGFGFQGISKFGITKDRAIGFDIGIAGAKIWLYNHSEVNFFANFKQGKYGFKIAQQIGAGAEAWLWPISLGVDVSVSGSLEGGYSSAGWYVDANLSARFAGYAGSCNQEERNDCRFIYVCTCLGLPCGLVVCASMNLGLRVDSQNGLKIRL